MATASSGCADSQLPEVEEYTEKQAVKRRSQTQNQLQPRRHSRRRIEEDSPDLTEKPLPETAYVNQGRRLAACAARLELKYCHPYDRILEDGNDIAHTPDCPACAHQGQRGHGKKHTKACRQAQECASRWAAMSTAMLVRMMSELTQELARRQAAQGW